MAKAIITGALQALFSNGQLQNYTTTGCVPDGDVNDYQTGTGVFWRNVLHVWKTNSNLRTFLNQPDYQKMLRASADAVVNASPAGQSIETLTNRTAVLVAATAMLS
jgi:phospholipid N-methyltransferase